MRIIPFLALIIFAACSAIPNRSPSALVAGEWIHWPYEMEGCLNTKDQFLKKTSSQPISYYTLHRFECHVEKGKWRDFFTGEEILSAEEAIVTPVIPLSHLRKKDLESMPLTRVLAMMKDQDYLIVLKKGGEGEKQFLKNVYPLEAHPESQPGKCEYLGMWKDMKERWSISQTKQERRYLAAEASKCSAPEGYNRKFYKHWSKLLTSCDTRTDILVKSSVIPALRESGRECEKVLAGEWHDLYTGSIFTDPKLLDIDHYVPLQNASMSGGWMWPQWKKEVYANSQEDPYHLIAVSASENRKKGAKHPGLFMPPSEAYHCDYLKQWSAIKFRWGMRMTVDEVSAIGKLAAKCDKKTQKDIGELLELLSR